MFNMINGEALQEMDKLIEQGIVVDAIIQRGLMSLF